MTHERRLMGIHRPESARRLHETRRPVMLRLNLPVRLLGLVPVGLLGLRLLRSRRKRGLPVRAMRRALHEPKANVRRR